MRLQSPREPPSPDYPQHDVTTGGRRTRSASLVRIFSTTSLVGEIRMGHLEITTPPRAAGRAGTRCARILEHMETSPMLTRLHTAGAIALVLMLWPALAMAETVDVTPAVFYGLDILEALIGVAITAVLGWLAMIARPFVGERIASSAAEKLERAGKRAVTAARMRYFDRAWTIEIENEIVADVAQYLGQQLPDAAATVGLTPEGLRRFAARLLGEEIASLPPIERPQGYVGQAGLT